MSSKDPFTLHGIGSASKKDQRTSKNDFFLNRQTSKKFFAFSFAQCEGALIHTSVIFVSSLNLVICRIFHPIYLWKQEGLSVEGQPPACNRCEQTDRHEYSLALTKILQKFRKTSTPQGKCGDFHLWCNVAPCGMSFNLYQISYHQRF